MTKPKQRNALNETALVQEAQRGDAAAFDRLVRQHEAQLLSVTMGILGDRAEAYDSYQDTLVRAFLRLDTFRFDSSFSTWMTRIAINQALTARKKLHPERRRPIDEDVQVLPDTARADQQMEREEVGRAVERALDSLSGRERAVFVLKHRHGYRLREIAEMLDCAEGTVKNYLFRAVRKLRGTLAPHYQDLKSV